VDVWTIRPESATQELLRAGRGAGGGVREREDGSIASRIVRSRARQRGRRDIPNEFRRLLGYWPAVNLTACSRAVCDIVTAAVTVVVVVVVVVEARMHRGRRPSSPAVLRCPAARVYGSFARRFPIPRNTRQAVSLARADRCRRWKRAETGPRCAR